MLRRTRDTARDIDGWFHGLAGLADLVRIGYPARVNDGAAGARGAVEKPGRLLNESVTFCFTETTSARDYDRSFFEFRTYSLLNVRGDDCRGTCCTNVAGRSRHDRGGGAITGFRREGLGANDEDSWTVAGETGFHGKGAAEDRMFSDETGVIN